MRQQVLGLAYNAPAHGTSSSAGPLIHSRNALVASTSSSLYSRMRVRWVGSGWPVVADGDAVPGHRRLAARLGITPLEAGDGCNLLEPLAVRGHERLADLLVHVDPLRRVDERAHLFDSRHPGSPGEPARRVEQPLVLRRTGIAVRRKRLPVWPWRRRAPSAATSRTPRTSAPRPVSAPDPTSRTRDIAGPRIRWPAAHPTDTRHVPGNSRGRRPPRRRRVAPAPAAPGAPASTPASHAFAATTTSSNEPCCHSSGAAPSQRARSSIVRTPSSRSTSARAPVATRLMSRCSGQPLPAPRPPRTRPALRDLGRHGLRLAARDRDAVGVAAVVLVEHGREVVHQHRVEAEPDHPAQQCRARQSVALQHAVDMCEAELVTRLRAHPAPGVEKQAPTRRTPSSPQPPRAADPAADRSPCG